MMSQLGGTLIDVCWRRTREHAVQITAYRPTGAASLNNVLKPVSGRPPTVERLRLEDNSERAPR